MGLVLKMKAKQIPQILLQTSARKYEDFAFNFVKRLADPSKALQKITKLQITNNLRWRFLVYCYGVA